MVQHLSGVHVHRHYDRRGVIAPVFRMNIGAINFRRILVFTGIFALLSYYLLTWMNMLNDLYQRTGSDFMGFYTYGRIAQTKGIKFIYDRDEQERIQEQIVGHDVVVRYHTHLPFIAPVAAALVVGAISETIALPTAAPALGARLASACPPEVPTADPTACV